MQENEIIFAPTDGAGATSSV